MITELAAQENQPLVIQLTDAEADALSTLGRELATRTTWWGEQGGTLERSVIDVIRLSGGRVRITFRDVIGLVKIGQRQIRVDPKIPSAHFHYIISRSELAPRLASSSVSIERGFDWLELLARWCVDAAEGLMRIGIRKDYKDQTDELSEIRGQIQPLETALRIFAGSPTVVCSFDELSDDVPINRVVKSACECISRQSVISPEIRMKARNVAFRMDGVGRAGHVDRRARIDRLTARYSKVYPLALLILDGLGVTSASGRLPAIAFLVRTPELVEDGIRSILSDGLSEIEVKKRRMMLGNSGLSINPDLVFGRDLAIGDVKYRYLTGSWVKSDFNQIVAFATGFRTSHAALFGFASSTDPQIPKKVSIGPITTAPFFWNTNRAFDPSESAKLLVESVKCWLMTVSPAAYKKEDSV